MKSNELADLILEWAKNRNGQFMTADVFREIDEIFDVKDASDSLRFMYKKGLLARKLSDNGKFLYCNTKHAPKGFERFKDAAIKEPAIKRDVAIVEEKQEIIKDEDEMRANKVEETADQIKVNNDYDKNQAGIQPLSVIESLMSPDQFKGFLRGSVIKYIARCDKKGGLEDLKKARHYLDKLIEACANT
ncbi:MAG: DUF3310 domain-containing protein [Nitrosomonas sp.]|nr:DUF3310 domain-containing protein [Nitrosomonas sp.]